ncbi:hypothetical protein GPL15_10465 [Clostridium sp. MCC353]|uniref:hypothetical protein n=1 Tax=Clostridium sp. MCC353 TaxID=2592646 RepID=UPI001C01D158|nr:hypothetical protein [Clostridium sp. MCC353]MBT9776928.1 hypothetical protein [Clostridium sp. MCC353]
MVSAEVLVYGIRRAAVEAEAAEDRAAADKVVGNKAAEDRAAEDKVAGNKAAEDRGVADKVAADKVEEDKAAGMGMDSAEDKAFYIGYSKVRSTGHYTDGCVGCHFHS